MKVLNQTDFNLYGAGAYLQHGEWSQRPPGLIGDYGNFESESSGIMTGTAGWAQYRLIDFDGQQQALVTLRWSNPYIGSNSYSASVTPGSGYSIGYFGGRGDNAFVTFVLLPGDCDVDPGDGGTTCY